MPRAIWTSFLAGMALLLAVLGTVLLPGVLPRPALAAYSVNTQPSGDPNAPLERFDLIEAVRSAQRPTLGAEAVDLDVQDEIGAEFHLHSRRGRPLLFGAFCACSTCRETAKAWAELFREHPREFSVAALVALPKGDPLFDFHDSLHLNYVLIPDPQHALSAMYPGPGEGSAALGCPRAWVIDAQGRYRYIMPMGAAPTPGIMGDIRKTLGLSDETATRRGHRRASGS